MFGKKKEKRNKPIRVMHYEGLSDFPTNWPCTIEFNDNVFTIKKINPEVIVTLPAAQINSFSVMQELDFMLKYHGQAASTARSGVKYYLVVDYVSKEGTNKILAFWEPGAKIFSYLHIDLKHRSEYSL